MADEAEVLSLALTDERNSSEEEFQSPAVADEGNSVADEGNSVADEGNSVAEGLASVEEVKPLLEGELDEEGKIIFFCTVTDASYDTAVRYLEGFQWRSDLAVAGYFADFSHTPPPLSSSSDNDQLDDEGKKVLDAEADPSDTFCANTSSFNDDESSLTRNKSSVSSSLTTTITVALGDGTDLELSFRYDQTIRDIRERIGETRPDDDGKDYYLVDEFANELRDLDQTIEEAHLGGSKLIQMYD